MKSSKTIFVVIIALSVIAIGGYAFSKKSPQADLTMNKSEGVMQKDETTAEPTDVMMKKDGDTTDNSLPTNSEKDKMMVEKKIEDRYIQYSKTALMSASKNRRVLFFYASWCPTCKPADTSFTQNVSKIPEDMTLVRVNYNDPDTDQEEKDLAKRYGITYQHTFVQIDGDGKEITRWNGGQIEELISNIK